MKTMRKHLLIVLALFLATFIVGSFLDEAISASIFSRDNTFGLIVSVLGVIPGHMLIAFLGGGFLSLAFRKEEKVGLKVLWWILAIACLGEGIFYAGREFFGPNGFPVVARWVGYFIAVPFIALGGFFGFVVTKRSKMEKIWLLYVILAVAAFMALMPGVTLLKSIFHRPRFRAIDQYPDIVFHSWWVRCGDYKDLMAQYGITSEEFKSFPSGHAGTAAIALMFGLVLPIVDKERFGKYKLFWFYGALVWVLLVAFCRILVGAHFLSDVSMGPILSIVFIYIGNEVILACKGIKEKEELPPPEEAPAEEPAE